MSIPEFRRRIDIETIASNLKELYQLLQLYPPGRYPSVIASRMKTLLADAQDEFKGTLIPPPDLSLISGKSPYFENPELRKAEVESGSRETGLTKEGAFKFVTDKIQWAISLPPEDLDTKVSWLLALEGERLKQNPDTVDLREIPFVKDEYFKACNLWRQMRYDAEIHADWSLIYDRYEKQGDFHVDLGDFKVYPTALTMNDEVHSKFKTKPQVSLCSVLTYEPEEEELCKKTQKELREGEAHMDMTYSLIHAVNWRIGIYSQRVEPLYQSFKGWITEKLEHFRKVHGSLTPQMVFPLNDNLYHIPSFDAIKLGFKVELKGESGSDDEHLTATPTSPSRVMKLKKALKLP